MNYKEKYIKYKNKYLQLKHKNNQSGGGTTEQPTLYLFKADWCGHCNSFKNEWENIIQNPIIKNKIKFETVDSTNTSMINKWGINGFPTLILKTDNKAIEYTNERSAESIIKFINSELK